jgi:hypothetical protein
MEQWRAQLTRTSQDSSIKLCLNPKTASTSGVQQVSVWDTVAFDDYCTRRHTVSQAQPANNISAITGADGGIANGAVEFQIQKTPAAFSIMFGSGALMEALPTFTLHFPITWPDELHKGGCAIDFDMAMCKEVQTSTHRGEC